MPDVDPIESQPDPTEDELNNDQGNEAALDESIAEVGGGGFAANAAANAEAVTNAGEVLEEVAANEEESDNVDDGAAELVANGYIPLRLVPRPDDSGSSSSSSNASPPWGGVPGGVGGGGAHGAPIYDVAQLINGDPDAPVLSAANQYDSVHSPISSTNPDVSSSGQAAGGNTVSVATNQAVQGAVAGTNAQQIAQQAYRARIQNRCLKMTVGLTAAGVVGGLAYYFIAVYKAGGQQQATTPPAPSPTPPPGPAPTPPPVPAGLQAVAQGQGAIQLFWELADLATGYVVKRDGKEIGRTVARVNSYLDSGLGAGTQYCYTVAAFNGAGSSADSAQVCATTMQAPPPAPAAPTGLTGLALSATSIRFSWLASQGATSYTVKRRLTTATAFAVAGTVPAGTTRLTFDDTGLGAGTQYAYTVSATNAAGTSADAEFIVLATKDSCEVLADQAVTQWNQLDEATFWDQWSNWITTDTPSFDCQFNVAMFSQGIVDKSAAPVLNTEALIQKAVDEVLAAYNARKDTLQIYTTLKTLTAGRGTPVNRYEKLNVLGRVLASILASAPETASDELYLPAD